METSFDEQKAQEKLNEGLGQAEDMLNDPDALEQFLQKLEKKLRVVPLVGDALASVPVLVSLVRCYVKKEYLEVPVGSILAILSALIYFVSPIDVVPDFIPGLGYIDDAAVIGLCLKWVESDVQNYILWREDTGKVCD